MTPATLFPSEPEPVAYPGEPAIWLQRVVILPSRQSGVEPVLPRSDIIQKNSRTGL